MGAISQQTSGRSDSSEPINNNVNVKDNDERSGAAESFVREYRDNSSNTHETVNISKDGVSFGQRETTINFKSEDVKEKYEQKLQELKDKKEEELKNIQAEKTFAIINMCFQILRSGLNAFFSPGFYSSLGKLDIGDKIESIENTYDKNIETLTKAYDHLDTIVDKGYDQVDKETLVEQKTDLVQDKYDIDKLSHSIEKALENGVSPQDMNMYLRLENAGKNANIGKMIETINDKGWDVSNVKEEVHNLNEEFKGQIQDKQDIVNNNSTRMEELQSQNHTNQDHININKDEISSLQNEIKELKQDKENDNKELIQEKQEKLNELRAENKELINDNKINQSEFNELKAENKELIKDINDIKEEMSPFRDIERALDRTEEMYDNRVELLEKYDYNMSSLDSFMDDKDSIMDSIRLEVQDLSIGISYQGMMSNDSIFDKDGNPYDNDKLIETFQAAKEVVNDYQDLKNSMSAEGGNPELTSEQEADLKLARETMANIKQYMSLNEITDMSQLNKKH